MTLFFKLSSLYIRLSLVSVLTGVAEADGRRQLPNIEDLEFVSLHGYFTFPEDDPHSGLSYLGTSATLVDPDSLEVYGSLLMLYNKGEDQFVRILIDTRKLLDDHHDGNTCVPNTSKRYYRAVAETKVVGFVDHEWDEPWDPKSPTGRAVKLKMQNDDLSECRLDVGELSTLFHEDSTEKEGFAWLAGGGGDDEPATEVALPEALVEVRSVDDEEEQEEGEGDESGEEQEESEVGDEDDSSGGSGGGDGDVEESDEGGSMERDASKKSLAPGVSEIDTEMSQIGERRYVEEKQVSLMALAYAMQESAALRTGTAMLFSTHLWPLEDVIAILDERSDELEKNLDAAFQDLVDTSEKVAFPLVDRLAKEFNNMVKEIKAMPGPTEPYPLADLRAEVRGGGGEGEAMPSDGDEEEGGDAVDEEGENEGEEVDEADE